MQEVVSETASCALKSIDHGLKPELIPCSIKCARLLHVQPVSLRGPLSSSVLRERVETAEGFIYKYISNHRTELLGFWQGFLWPLQTIHCCSKAVSANWLRASLPGGAKKKKKPSKWGNGAGGKMCPGHLGSVPCACFAVVVAQTTCTGHQPGQCTEGSRARSYSK